MGEIPNDLTRTESSKRLLPQGYIDLFSRGCEPNDFDTQSREAVHKAALDIAEQEMQNSGWMADLREEDLRIYRRNFKRIGWHKSTLEHPLNEALMNPFTAPYILDRLFDGQIDQEVIENYRTIIDDYLREHPCPDPIITPSGKEKVFTGEVWVLARQHLESLSHLFSTEPPKIMQ